MGYRVEVIADSSGKWAPNGLVFMTRDLATSYAIRLAMRWVLVRDWRVVETDETPNTNINGEYTPRREEKK